MSSADPVLLVYVTAPNRDVALMIARDLIDNRLAACANILPGVTSVYRWEGAVCEDEEIVLVAKTTQAGLDRLTDRVKKLHPYDCPCVVGLPIEAGNAEFLGWVRAETSIP